MRKPTSGPGRLRTSLRGWWLCLPFLLPVFGVLFSEIWMRTAILGNTYEANDFNEAIRETQGRIDALLKEKHDLVRMERIHAKAPDLGLIEPYPGQIVEVFDTLPPHDTAPDPAYVVARQDALVGGAADIPGDGP